MSHDKPHIEKLAIVRALFAAYLANDRATVEGFLADNFRFTSPYDDRIDKATYFARCWRSPDWIEHHELEKMAVEGDVVFVTYKCLAKDGKSFRNTEMLCFEGGKVGSIDVYFGATYRNGVFARQPQ